MFGAVAGLPARVKGFVIRRREQPKPGLVQEVRGELMRAVFAQMVVLLYDEYGPDWRKYWAAMSECEKSAWLDRHFSDHLI